MNGRRSGDGFLHCSDGRHRWGLFGAAGALFFYPADDGPLVLIQHRSQWSHEGGTWSIPGGALDEGETPTQGALREASEEIGPVPEHRVVDAYEFAPATDWSYTTVLVEVGQQFGEAASFETEGLDWVPVDEVDGRPLHDGFASAWPHLRQLVIKHA